MSYVGNAPYQGVVDTGNIVDNAITSPKIAPDTVVAADIAPGAVGASELATGAAVANIGYTPLNPANNLSEVTASTARTNLGLGTLATVSPTGTPSSSTFLRGDNSWQTVTQTRVSGGTTGLTPNTLTSGDVTLGGVLVASNGGTGLSNPGTSGNILVSNGSTWVSQAPAASGKVLQVKQLVVSSALTQTGGQWTTWVDLSGYSFSITPSSSSSRILYQISFGAMTQSTNAIVFRLVRNGTIIGVGDASGSRPQATFRNMREGDTNHTRTAPHFTYLDSPGTTS